MSSGCPDQPCWAELQAQSAHDTVFADSGYLDQMAQVSDGLLAHASETSVGCLGIERRRGPIREFGLPLFSPFSGIALPNYSQADVHAKKDSLAALGALLEGEFDRIRLHLPPSIVDVRPLQWRGWELAPLYTYVLLPENGPAGWSSSARRTLRKSAEQFHAAHDQEAAPEVVELMLASYRRHGRPHPADAGGLVAACQSLIRAQMADCLVARDAQGVAVAGIVLLHGETTSYYWLAGSDPGPGMTVLMAFALEFLFNRGQQWFDLVGANTPTIAEFKRRFGPELSPYWSATYQSGPAMRLISAGKSLLGR